MDELKLLEDQKLVKIWSDIIGLIRSKGLFK